MNDRKTPLWETLVMAGSFGALWLYFAARLSHARLPGGLAEHPLSPAWSVLLGASVVALVVILVRRIKRVKAAMREELDARRGPFGTPARTPHRNGHNGSKRG